MVCPMRVVLVAVSLAVAALVALYWREEVSVLEQHIDEDACSNSGKSESGRRGGAPASRANLEDGKGSRLRNTVRFLWEAGTGLYLWRVASGKAAWQVQPGAARRGTSTVKASPLS